MKAFFQSPTNRTAFAAWFATAIVAAWQYFALHQMPSSADAVGLILGFVKILEPDLSVTVPQMQKAIADVQTAVQTNSPAAIDAALKDGEVIAGGVVKPV